MSDESQQQERPTHTITTSNGYKIELKDWITGREEDEIQKVYLDAIEMKQKQGVAQGQKGSENAARNQQQMEQEITGMKGSLQIDAERKAMEMVVVSVDGQTDKIVDNILDLPRKDKNEVKDEVNRITSDKDEEQKKSEQE